MQFDIGDENAVSAKLIFGNGRHFVMFTCTLPLLTLALLQDMKLHEESRFAVCLQFRSLSGSPYMWVVYCVQQLEQLARLYITLRQAAARRNYAT